MFFNEYLLNTSHREKQQRGNSILKAMIFAAGLGTRLQPVTEKIPKALIEIGGKPMIERVILKLKKAGVTEIIINLHHFPEKIKSFLDSKNNFNIKIEYSIEEDQPLETGGGLKKAAWFFDDGKPFFLHNVDILSNVDLNKFMGFHLKTNPLATLFVQKRKSSRYLLFDKTMQLCGWTNKNTGETILSKETSALSEFAFNGIHVIKPEIFNLLKMDGKFSIIPAYLNLAKNHDIIAYQENTAAYLDIGKPESIAQAESLLKKMA